MKELKSCFETNFFTLHEQSINFLELIEQISIEVFPLIFQQMSKSQNKP